MSRFIETARTWQPSSLEAAVYPCAIGTTDRHVQPSFCAKRVNPEGEKGR